MFLHLAFITDMLGKNGEGEPGSIAQHGSVGLDHCYASLPTPPGTATVVINSTQSLRGAPRVSAFIRLLKVEYVGKKEKELIERLAKTELNKEKRIVSWLT